MKIQGIREVITADSLMGYIEEVAPEYGQIDAIFGQLFPNKRIVGLDYSYIKKHNNAVELTAPSAFDAEPIAQNREGFDAISGELPLFRRKMNIFEREYSMLDIYLKGNQEAQVKALLTQIYDDQLRLTEGAQATMNYLKAKALLNGGINLVSKGGAVKVDYGVKHKYATDWTDKAKDVAHEMQLWLDTVEDETGTRPTRMIMNRATFRLFRENEQIKLNMLPLGVLGVTNASTAIVITDDAIMSTMKALFGITEIYVVNKKVKLDGKLLELVADGEVAIFEDGALGDFLIGTSPAERASGTVTGAQISVTSEGIAINVKHKDNAPYTAETQAEFIGLPSMPTSNTLIIANVGHIAKDGTKTPGTAPAIPLVPNA